MSFDSRLERILAGKPQSLIDAVASTRLLKHAAALLEQRMDAALAPLGLHMREYLALYLLSDSVHEPISPSTLSLSLDATRTQVTRLLDSLEAKALAVRTADAQDRRALQLALTERGTHLLEQAIPLVQAVHLQTWAVLGEEGTGAMRQQLRKVLAGLETGIADDAQKKKAASARSARAKTSKNIARTDDPAAP